MSKCQQSSAHILKQGWMVLDKTKTRISTWFCFTGLIRFRLLLAGRDGYSAEEMATGMRLPDGCLIWGRRCRGLLAAGLHSCRTSFFGGGSAWLHPHYPLVVFSMWFSKSCGAWRGILAGFAVESATREPGAHVLLSRAGKGAMSV
jgi:hypothetical protein